MKEIQNFKYRLGVDIGIASVGVAALQVNAWDEPEHIIDLAVRTFNKPEVPKNGESLAKARREARSQSRRGSRKKNRRQNTKYFLVKNGVLTDIKAFEQKYHRKGLPNVYELRVKALSELLSNEELAQILLFMQKHRGFKSNRKAGKSKDDGQMLAAIKESSNIMSEKGYRTVGEMILRDDLFHIDCPWDENVKILSPRNKSGNYSRTMLRANLEDEVRVILKKQREFGNTIITDAFIEEYISIFSSQRSFDEGPGPMAGGKPNHYALNGFADKVGFCTFEPKEHRASKAAYSSELFIALEAINHLRIEDQYGEKRGLTEEERKLVFDLIHKKKEVKYSQVRTLLAIEKTDSFVGIQLKTPKKMNVEEVQKKKEDKVFVSLKYSHAISKILEIDIKNSSIDELCSRLDPIAEILTHFKSDEKRINELGKLSLSDEQIDLLLALDPSGHIRLSIKAVRKINLFLLNGDTYDKACANAGYTFSGDDSSSGKLFLLKGPEITAQINDIANPVVRRSLSQTLKVINGMILRYGSPQAINIELAREMSKNFNERNEIQKEQDENESRNARIVELLSKEYHISSPKGQDILKYRLWEEQNGICMYSMKPIPADRLFTGEYEIDHILPYSKTGIDAFSNKVLVEAGENREKGNRIPFEYFGNDAERWGRFESLVSTTYHGSIKAKRMLKRKLSAEEMAEFRSKNLNDTRYIAKMLRELIAKHLRFEAFSRAGKKKHVTAVNGSITAYLRKRWGLAAKDRRIDRHHAQDAIVIACVTDGMIQKISRYSQARELQYSRNLSFVDEETGEIFSPRDYTREEWDKLFGAKIPLPWKCFKTEVEVRMGDHPKEFILSHSKVSVELNYSDELLECVRPLFVSRMPNHKVTGAAHLETIFSAKYYDSQGIIVSKTKLTELKMKTDSETGEYVIDKYFMPERDKLLYNALLKALIAHKGNAKEAFAQPFYKPKADGSRGPLVKSVKTCEKMTSGVRVLNGKGIAANDRMIRTDVFCENGKYYLVPIYTSDVVKKEIPMKACVAHKPVREWKTMRPENFVFSMYPDDLLCIKKKGGIKATELSNSIILEGEQFLYYVGMDISAASISCRSHDSALSVRGLGVQSLAEFKKCKVDVLGNISFCEKERRQSFGE